MNIDWDFAIRLLDLILDAILAYCVWKMYKERKAEMGDETDDEER